MMELKVTRYTVDEHGVAGELMQAADYKKGLRALIEKRPPRFARPPAG